ncbi:hypothetical protein D3C80_2236470 [compost metagenome]
MFEDMDARYVFFLDVVQIKLETMMRDGSMMKSLIIKIHSKLYVPDLDHTFGEM